MADMPDAAPLCGPEIAGFYVNWDDNSLASFRAHTRGYREQLTS